MVMLNPGLRPGLTSANFSRPYGTRFRDGRSDADAEALSGTACCGTVEAAPCVLGRPMLLWASSSSSNVGLQLSY
jgi:hypothetical protein